MRTLGIVLVGVAGMAGVARAQTAVQVQRPVAVQAAPVAAAAPAPVQAAPAAPSGVDPAAVERLKAFVQAYNSHNPAAVVDFFTDEAVMFDADGGAVRGKAAIGQQFATGLTQPSIYTLESEIESGRAITPDVAEIEGVTRLKAANEATIVNRFVALIVKKDNVWRIAEVRDLPATSSDYTPAERLAELEWMVGDWVSETPEARIQSTVRWGEGKAFLIRNTSAQAGNEAPSSSLMILAWDPKLGQIKSWLFSSNGTQGEGTWARAAGNQWVIRAEGVHADGAIATATQIVTLENNDALKTVTVDRVSDGVVVADTDEILMVRRPPAPATVGAPAAPVAPGAAVAPAPSAAPTVIQTVVPRAAR